jgi:hypothetical protein
MATTYSPSRLLSSYPHVLSPTWQYVISLEPGTARFTSSVSVGRATENAARKALRKTVAFVFEMSREVAFLLRE